MAIFNLGSINADHFYDVPTLPAPGETIAAIAHHVGLGGKGANQSIAAARAGARVFHIGAVGPDGGWAVGRMHELGVNTDYIATLDIPTGHAIVSVDAAGENAIVIHSSANAALDEARITDALGDAMPGDILVLQAETNLGAFTAELAQSRDMRVVYSAAPFDADHAQRLLPFTDLLVVNALEAGQLAQAMGVNAQHLPVPETLITRGGEGATFRSARETIDVRAFAVAPQDTTGAGDTYLGYYLAGVDAEMDRRGAMTFAAAAAALQVTRKGAAEAIPSLIEVKAFLEKRLEA